MVEPLCSKFRVITANFSDVRNFSDVTIILLALCEFFRVFKLCSYNISEDKEPYLWLSRMAAQAKNP